MEIVDFNDYFRNKYYDGHLIKFFQFDHSCIKAAAGSDNVIYVLNTAPNSDEKVAELYTRLMKIRKDNKTFKKGNKKGKVKKLQSKIDYGKNVFEEIDRALKILNRIAERENSWIVYPLFILASELVKITLWLARLLESKGGNTTSEDAKEFIEKCGRGIHRSFSLCLNDRNPDFDNRQTGVYMFANLEFKIYHRLRNLDMIKNLVKVLKSRQDRNLSTASLPKLEDSLCREHRAEMVRHNYYMGRYYGCQENDFGTAFNYLCSALMECDLKYRTQLRKILVLLIPFGILSRKVYPNYSSLLRLCFDDSNDDNNNNNEKNGNDGNGDSPKHTEDIPQADVYLIRDVLEDVVKSLRNGDLSLYDKILQNEVNEILFLQRGIYVAMQLIRELVLLKLVKNCYKMLGGKTIIPFDALLLKFNDDSTELECQLANLISKRYIRGYLSHSNRCLVVSKTESFPRLVKPIPGLLRH